MERHSLSLERTWACLLDIMVIRLSLSAGQTLRTPSFNLHNNAVRKVLLLTLFNSAKPLARGHMANE